MTTDVNNLARLALSTEQTLVYLVRHGQTYWNKEQRFQGHLDVPLSEAGIEQAAMLGEWLRSAGVTFSAVYSSDLQRAAQTAEAISASIGSGATHVPALREINCGDWEGLLASELEERQPEQVRQWRTVVETCAMPGGESLLEVQRRVFRFYRGAVAAHGGEAIVLVTHGAALSALVAAIMGADLGEVWRERRLRHDNTGITAVLQDHDSPVGQVLFSNLVQHLAGPRPAPGGPSA